MAETKNIVLCKWQAELLDSLLALGADVYLILDRYDRLGGKPERALTERCRRVYGISNFDSLEEVSAIAVDLCLANVAIDTVISHNELSQFGSGYLELLLGRQAQPLLHVAHRDKRLMKRLVRKAGVTTADFRSLVDPGDLAALPAVLDGLPMPVIVKPAAGYGGVSTLRAETATEFEALLRDFTFDPLLRSRQLIVEEFIHGAELAVDSIWVDGAAATFVVHRYHEPRLNMNVPTKLDGSLVLNADDYPDLYGRLQVLHRRVNSALGIRTGATHMEVFVRPDGEIVFSEIATRIGGAWIPGLLSAHLGHSVWRMLAEATLQGTYPQPKPVYRYVAAVHIRPAKPGIISSVPSDEELAAFPAMVSWRMLRHVGDRARLNHPSDYYLHVVIGAESAEEIEALCPQVAQTFTIETTDARI